MRENRVRKLLAQGETVLNGWLSIGNSFSAEVMSAEAFDSVTVDTQHGMSDIQAAIEMLLAVSSKEPTPMARVNWNDPAPIMKLLDAGAYGIICPMINNRDECERFVQACRYPPAGYRSFGPARGLLYGGADYYEHANATVFTMAMIETRDAMGKLDEIMAVEGLDGIYIGPLGPFDRPRASAHPGPERQGSARRHRRRHDRRLQAQRLPGNTLLGRRGRQGVGARRAFASAPWRAIHDSSPPAPRRRLPSPAASNKGREVMRENRMREIWADGGCVLHQAEEGVAAVAAGLRAGATADFAFNPALLEILSRKVSGIARRDGADAETHRAFGLRQGRRRLRGRRRRPRRQHLRLAQRFHRLRRVHDLLPVARRDRGVSGSRARRRDRHQRRLHLGRAFHPSSRLSPGASLFPTPGASSPTAGASAISTTWAAGCREAFRPPTPTSSRKACGCRR